MSKPVLYFAVDPLCGWTYAAGPLMKVSLLVSELDVQVHCGGMLVENNRKAITPKWEQYVEPHDAFIAKVSGQHFSTEYQENILRNYSVTLDSDPASTAILIAKSCGLSPVEALIQLQTAYYSEGMNISAYDVVAELSLILGIDKKTFKRAYQQQQPLMKQHYQDTHLLLQKIKGQGWPSAALDINGEIVPLKLSQFYGDEKDWLLYLTEKLSQLTAPDNTPKD